MCVDERILKTGDHDELGVTLQTISIDPTLTFFVHFLNRCTNSGVGREWDTRTGRKRRCGWIDLFFSKYSTAVNHSACFNIFKLEYIFYVVSVTITSDRLLQHK